RSAGSRTAVPTLTRFVRAATAAISVSGSWRGRAVMESPIHTESKPAASARSAMASSGPVSGRPDMIASRVGISTPNFTLIVALRELAPSLYWRQRGVHHAQGPDHRDPAANAPRVQRGVPAAAADAGAAADRGAHPRRRRAA